ncbi:MAG: sipW [Candidatus Saccharibacteria bacterium]|nr:sipW [Candidatus Saccharibacteria bacterium]
MSIKIPSAVAKAAYWVGVLIAMVSMGGTVFAYTQGYQFMSVQSDSMQPYVAPGGAVVVDRKDTNIHEGDVITYRSPVDRRTVNTHRVVAIDVYRGVVTTKGDNALAVDTVVPLQNVLGTVRYRLPFLGYGLDILKRPLGLLAVIYLPASFVVMAEVRRLTKYYSAPPRHYLLYR